MPRPGRRSSARRRFRTVRHEHAPVGESRHGVRRAVRCPRAGPRPTRGGRTAHRTPARFGPTPSARPCAIPGHPGSRAPRRGRPGTRVPCRGSAPRGAGPPPSVQLPNGCFSALLLAPRADRPPMARRRYPTVGAAPVTRRRRMRRVHRGPGRCRPAAVDRAAPRAEGARERAIALRFRLAPSQRCFELLLSSLAGSAPTFNALESTRSW
ncbi:hypothetical protein GPN2_20275 [Streptomyces murinus]